MNTSVPVPRSGVAQARRASIRARMLALVRAEFILLLRNRTALFNAVALAPLTVAFIAWTGADAFLGRGEDTAVAGMLPTMLATLALVVVVYYNLTTTFVSRREELVLKRLLTGEVSRAEILTAYATPAVAISTAQLVLGTVAMGLWIALPRVQNIVWLTIGLVGGIVLLVLLAAAGSGLTRTVETAQLTTLPMLAVATGLSGVFVPLSFLPDVVQAVAIWSPMYPVVTLIQHGLGAALPDGSTASGAQPLACLIAWLVVGVVALRHWMRWEPRR